MVTILEALLSTRQISERQYYLHLTMMINIIPKALFKSIIESEKVYKPPRQIKEKYNLKWDTESIQYLGVNLSADQSKIYGLNYGSLNKTFKSDLLRWNLIHLYSLSSKVDSVQMVILPKYCIYFKLFQ